MDMEYVQLHPTGFVDPANRDAHTKVYYISISICYLRQRLSSTLAH